MYKRLERNITIYHLRDSVDDYGQPRLEWDSKVESKGSFYLTSQMNSTNPDFLDVDAVLVLRENYLDSHYIIEIDDQKYRIKYSLPMRPVRSRFTQYLLADTNESPEEYIENGVFWKIEEVPDTYYPETIYYYLHLRNSPAEGYLKENPETEDSYPSWYDRRGDINRVYIDEEIQPTTACGWFKEMTNLWTITGTELIDLSKCTNLYHMFHTCGYGRIGNIKFKNGAPLCKNMQSMFKDCKTDYIDATGLCTASNENLNSTFYGCTAFVIDGLGTWDTSKVTKFNSIFNTCTYLQRIDGIETWDTSKGDAMNNCFSRTKNLPFINISNWTIPNATTLSGMFNYSSARSIDIEKFSPGANLTTVKNMFQNCNNLTCINCNDTTFTLPAGCDKSATFTGCYELPNWGEGTTADAWSYYVTSNSPRSATPEYESNRLSQIEFRFPSGGDPSTSVYWTPYSADYTSLVAWNGINYYNDYGHFGINWSDYSGGTFNYRKPFRIGVFEKYKLASYIDYNYPVDESRLELPNPSYDTSNNTIYFNGTPLAEGEWYWMEIYKDGNWYSTENSIDNNFIYYPLEAGTYEIRSRRCKFNHNPSSTQSINFSIE